tara:strand:+ start:14064 stop:14813 length:750 start_codon:yes stop_codon:yes gene_type:complete
LINTFDIYQNPSLYDDQYWWKRDDIEFYKKIIPSNSKVLELGSGTGRLGVPLLRNDVEYFGLELSKEFCNYTRSKLLNKEHQKQIIHGDMTSFKIDHKFDYIFVAFNTFLHLLTNDKAAQCFQCVKSHLSDNGIFILDIVHPHPSFLFKSNNKPELVMDFKDSTNDDIVEIYEYCEYNHETEICDIIWEYRYQKHVDSSKQFKYQMRMYYPDTINRLLIDNGFYIDEVYGDYDMNRFKEHSQLQIYKAI